MIKFMSIASGSSGNCYYLSNGNQALLIDAGIPLRSITKALKDQLLSVEGHVMGVLVTHDHADHIRTVGSLGDKLNLPVFATEKVLNGIDCSRYVDSLPMASRRMIVPEQTFALAGFDITPFPIPHDATENVGYHITAPSFSFTLCTDVGHITDTISHYASKAEYLVIEANYDCEMLLSGPYPSFLKERVSGPLGHLSNQETGDFLARIFRPEMKHVWLCHLSKDNNHPELCWKSIEYRLFNEGIRVGKDLDLTVLKRSSPSELYTLSGD